MYEENTQVLKSIPDQVDLLFGAPVQYDQICNCWIFLRYKIGPQYRANNQNVWEQEVCYRFMHPVSVHKGQNSLSTFLCIQCYTHRHTVVTALSCVPGKDFCPFLKHFKIRNWLLLLETNNIVQRHGWSSCCSVSNPGFCCLPSCIVNGISWPKLIKKICCWV